MFLTNVLQQSISELGIQAEFFYACDGEEAVKLFKEAHPYLVFLDLTMPKKNGMESLQEILEHDCAAKVVVVTADGQKISHDKALQLGALDYITKPISEEKLERKLHAWL